MNGRPSGKPQLDWGPADPPPCPPFSAVQASAFASRPLAHVEQLLAGGSGQLSSAGASAMREAFYVTKQAFAQRFKRATPLALAYLHVGRMRWPLRICASICTCAAGSPKS